MVVSVYIIILHLFKFFATRYISIGNWHHLSSIKYWVSDVEHLYVPPLWFTYFCISSFFTFVFIVYHSFDV